MTGEIWSICSLGSRPRAPRRSFSREFGEFVSWTQVVLKDCPEEYQRSAHAATIETMHSLSMALLVRKLELRCQSLLPSSVVMLGEVVIADIRPTRREQGKHSAT